MIKLAPLPLRRSLFVLFSGFALSAAASSAALAAINVPSNVAPGQVQKRFEAPLTAPESPDLKLPTPVDNQPSPEEAAKLAKKKFVLKSVVIEDSTAYGPDAFASAYADSIGKEISLLDARAIAQQITNKYRNDGYVLSQAVVTPQDVTSGELRIRVVEGVVGSVTLQGDVRNDSERKIIEGFGEKMKELKPARVQDLERYLLLINDLAGVTVSGLLRPQADQFAAAELVLSLKNETFDGLYTFDNRGSKYIGPWQHQMQLGTNTTLGYYDRTQGRFLFVSPSSDELLGGDVHYSLPIGSEGTNLGFIFSRIHTNPASTLSSLDVVGTSTQANIRLEHPFVRQRKENLLGRFVLSYEDSITDVFRDQPFTYDRMRIARLGGTYNLIDSYRGNNLLDIEISQGMNILSATDSGDNRSNVKGDASFTKFNMDVQRLQYLPEDFSLLIAGKGQYSLDPLLADEQMSLGGSDYARAFDPVTVLGDHGAAGKLELRYTQVPEMRFLNDYQIYSFYDIGRVWIREGAAGANNKQVRSSTGAGVRLTINNHFSGSFEAAVPLISPSNEQTKYRNDPRLFVSLTARF